MFDEVCIPKKITPSPIAEAIFEIRFSSEIPGAAYCGLLLPLLNTTFPSSIIEEFPILQLPLIVRESDPHLKFQPHYRVTKDNFSFAFGPNSFVFQCSSPYCGWKEWSGYFCAIIKDLRNVSMLKKATIQRLGLRYIDHIHENIWVNSDVSVQVDGKSVSQCNTQLRTELQEEDVTVVLNIATGGPSSSQQDISIIDIDCMQEYNELFDTFAKNVEENTIIEKLHLTNKKFFFGIMHKQYIDTLNPVY